MFPRRRRIARGDFTTALRGRRLNSKNFSFTVPHHGEGYAVVVSKGTARLSTARHLLKRRVLSVLSGLPLPPSLVVFPKAGAFGLSFAELKAELKEALGKISR